MLKPRIVIVDDEEPQTRSFARHFCDEFEVVEVNDPETLMGAIDPSTCAAIVDERMGEISGITVLSELRTKHPNIIRILITGYGDEYLATAINEARIFHYVEKPYDPTKLRGILNEAVREFRVRHKGLEQLLRFEQERDLLAAHREGRTALRETLGFSAIIGKSKAIHQLIEKAHKVVNQPVSILINGETGTGKDVLARAIHNESTSPHFHEVNCGLFANEGLARTELFGVVKGAFTDAVARPGVCELADKGTLFLNEIGELPLSVQPMLLTFLDRGEFVRVGSSTVMKSHVRLIAATYRNLQEEVAKGRFREDLYFRLKSFHLRVPSLRERPEDIPLLAEHFVKIASAKFGQVFNLSEETLEILIEYNFPGNIRELQFVIESAAAECGGQEIHPRHLPLEIHSSVVKGNNLSTRVDEYECAEIHRALATSKTQEEAAAKLGITSRWLRKRLKDCEELKGPDR